MATVKPRAGVVVRLSAADLQAAGEVTSELGVPMARLFSACALEVAARLTPKDADFGPAPERFAAAELLHLSFSPEELASLEQAARTATFRGPAGRPVAVTVPQFVSCATSRLIQAHRAPGSGQSALRGLLAAGKGDRAEAAAGPRAAAALDTARGAALSGEPSTADSTRFARPLRSESSRPTDPLRVLSADRADPRNAFSKAAEPLRATSGASLDPSRAALGKVDAPRAASGRSAASARSAAPPTRPASSSAGEVPPTTGAAASPAHAKGISRNDLRLALLVGVATLLSLIGAIVYFGRGAHAPATALVAAKPPPAPTPTPAAAPAPPAPLDLPPPPEFTPAQIAQMRAELDQLTRHFHDKNATAKRIDTLLRDVYGRPRVSPELASATQPREAKLLSVDANDRQFDTEILTACDAVQAVYPVPPALVKAVIRRESSFNPKAVSVVGAVGLMQLMPFNAERVGLTEKDLWDPAKNILAGTRLLAVLLKFYHGDVISTLVAYNAKPRDLFASIPRNTETPGYVAAVLSNYEAYSGEPLRNQLLPASRESRRDPAATISSDHPD